MKYLTLSVIFLIAILSSCKKSSDKQIEQINALPANIKTIKTPDFDHIAFSFEYDSKGKLRKRIRTDLYTDSLVYDGNNRVYSIITKINNVGKEVRTAFINYSGGRVTSIKYPEKQQFQYGDGAINYVYNNDGRVTEENRTYNNAIYEKYTYTYNADGDLTMIEGYDDYYKDIIIEIKGYNEEMNVSFWQLWDFDGFFRQLSGPVIAGLKHFPKEVTITKNGTFYNKTVYNFVINNKRLNEINFTTAYIGTPLGKENKYYYIVNY